MKAAVCYEFGKPLVIEDIDISPPGKGEVKVRLAATAVCHSDIHVFRGELPFPLPAVGGHESSGYVEDVGEGVTKVKTGDPVVVSLLIACGKCFFCTTGRTHLCEAVWARDKESPYRNKKGQSLVQMFKIGSFAEYTIVDESQVVKIPDDMPLESASLLACGVITGFGAVVNRAKVEVMSSCVIIGVGGVGLNSVQGAAISGAYPVVSIDINESADKLRKKIADGIKKVDQNDGVLILTDMFGGTPSNLSYSFLEEGRLEVISGANLPMLIKVISLRKDMPLGELAQQLEAFGKTTIKLASGILKGNKRG